ncbi:MAG: 3-oxoadipate enol-lactonase, partial [Gemmobacter sp.]
IRMDKRGHGLSDAPPAPYAMGALIHDAERVIDAAGVRGAVVVGCSIGGMIAQGLAVKRPDLVRALVLSNTAARIGTPAMWAERIAAVDAGGIAALADAVLARWFAPAFRATPEAAAWRHMLTRTPAAGYAGCCAAIAGADFLATTARLTLPTLAIAGSEDGSTPPDLVHETAGLIAGSRFHLIRGAGHLPCVEAPAAFLAALVPFLDTLPG